MNDAIYKKALFSKLNVELAVGEYVTYLEGASKHPGQAQIHFTDWMYFTAAWGRRTGKTIAAAAEVLFYLSKEGQRVWIAAPNYGLTDRVFEYVYRWAVLDQVFGKGSIVKASNTRERRYIETKWGSWVEGKSAEAPDSLIGEKLDFLVIDEAARLAENIFTELLEPCTLDRKGRVLFISTPRGKNWFYEYWRRGREEATVAKGWASSQFKSRDNPFVDSEWLKSKQAQTAPTIFRREYEASFEDFSGLIWPMYRDRYVSQGGHLFKASALPKVGTIYRGIDVGWRHPTYCIWGLVDGNDNMWLFREYKGEPSVVHATHARNINALSGGLEIYDTWISPDAKRRHPLGDRAEDLVSAYDIYVDNGIDCRPAVDDVHAGISVVGQYLQSTLNPTSTHPKLFISEELEHLRRGIERYVYTDQNLHKEQDAPEKPRKYKDDEVDALRYLLATTPRFDRTQMSGYFDRYGHWQNLDNEETVLTSRRSRRPGAPRIPGFV